MKKILTIAILLFSMASFAQGNLQFNQVLNLKNGDNYTVPNNKVLKIVSVNYYQTSAIVPLIACTMNSQSNSTCYYDDIVYFKIENVMSFRSGPFSSTRNSCAQCDSTRSVVATPDYPKMPIWLNSGKNIDLTRGVGISISAIEFNIVQ